MKYVLLVLISTLVACGKDSVEPVRRSGTYEPTGKYCNGTICVNPVRPQACNQSLPLGAVVINVEQEFAVLNGTWVMSFPDELPFGIVETYNPDTLIVDYQNGCSMEFEKVSND